MKKTIFIAVALSLLLCATAFADAPNPRISKGQKITVPFLMGKYASRQTMDTRIHILNNDAALHISVNEARLITPDGNDVLFSCDEDGNSVDPPSSNLVYLQRGSTGPIQLGLYASASINVPPRMFLCSDWTYSPLDADGYIVLDANYLDGGRPFIEVIWGSNVMVIPPEVWAFFRSRDKKGERVDYERWDGRVTEELP